MKALALFLLRLVTGLYLLAWSAVKLTDTPRAVEISEKLYFGLFGNQVLQHALGALGGVLGLFVILGFLRRFSYLTQALVLALGVGALARILAVPQDEAGAIETAIALTPYLALFVAALAPLLAKGDDILSLDRFLAWAERRLARDETAMPEVAVASAAAAVQAAEAVTDDVAQVELPHPVALAEEPEARETDPGEEPVEEAVVEAAHGEAVEEAVAEAEVRAQEEEAVEAAEVQSAEEVVAVVEAGPEAAELHAEVHEEVHGEAPAGTEIAEAVETHADETHEDVPVVEDHVAAAEAEAAHKQEAHPTVH